MAAPHVPATEQLVGEVNVRDPIVDRDDGLRDFMLPTPMDSAFES